MRKFISALIWLLVGAFFMFLTLKDTNLREMFQSIGSAKAFWVAMNGVTLLAVFFLRGYRWKLLIENAGEKPKFILVLYSLCMGFFVNSFTPRLGEVARCTTLKEANGIPVSKSLGTMVTERMWDVLVLLLGLLVIFILEVERLEKVWIQLMDGLKVLIAEKGLLLMVVGVGILVLAYIAYRILKRRKVFEKGKQFILEFWETFKLSFKIKKYPRFIVVTVLIWTVLAVMNYFSLLALVETADNSFYFAFVIVFVAGIGWAIPSPSGLGTTHFIVLHLFVAFGLSEKAGTAYGVLSNGLTFGFTILIGGMALLAYQLFLKKSNKQLQEV